MDAAIHINTRSKTFTHGRKALQRIDLCIAPGEMVALIGASGSGKSTLRRHMAGLMAGDAGIEGSVEIHGRTVQRNGKIAADIRSVRSGAGFIFQQFSLVGRLPVLLNVLAGTLHRAPLWRSLVRWSLSGGQQQRAAIARAMVQGAKVVLADEPIAALDPASSRKVMEVLARVNREDQCTVVVSLHQVNVAMKYCARTIALHQGKVVHDGQSVGLTPEVLRGLYGPEADDILSLGDHIASLEDKLKPTPRLAWPVAMPPLAHAA